MQVQYIIVGQGIAGTLFSYHCWRQGISFVMIDQERRARKASAVAGAVLNPVNVNKWSLVNDYDYYISHALASYKGLEETLNIPLVETMPLLVFHQEEAKKQLFEKQLTACPQYIRPADATEHIVVKRYFKDVTDIANVSPVYKIHASVLLSSWAGFLKDKGLLIEKYFDIHACKIEENGVYYETIQAEKIIFCEGAEAIHNPHFHKIPFNQNRGDALLISIPGLSTQYIYQGNVRLVPIEKDLFWCGGNHQWQFDNLLPDEVWRRQTESALRQWLTIPFKVEDHLVGQRPTTAGQFFVVGTHPLWPMVAILNGLGTKGFLWGPALSLELLQRLDHPQSTPIKNNIRLERLLS